MKIKKRTLTIIITILILALGIFVFFRTRPTPPQDILSVNLREHKNLALHIHPTVEIEILGKPYFIPPNIGISNSGMRVIHTHEQGGVLHVESPYPHQFYLKDFFTVWGKTFNEKCIVNYCTDENHALKVFVNGAQSNLFEAIPLRDGQKIKIVYAQNNST